MSDDAVTSFGFAVKQLTENPYIGVTYDVLPYEDRLPYEEWPRIDEWSVTLPHQCDDWEITGVLDRAHNSHANAVEDLERFSAEAQDALAALRERREIDPEENQP